MNARVDCIDHGLKGNPQGYARTFVRGENRKMLFHRYVFWQAHGYLPPVVMHDCDNTRCINIDHLLPGDWVTNNQDRARKGRSAVNVHTRRRLSEAQAREIRERFAVRTPRDSVNGPLALAREFGVDTKAIYQITQGRTYRDVA